MELLRTLMHPGVLPVDTLVKPRRQRGPYLGKGALDGACGPLTLWTALIALGVVTVARAKTMRACFSGDAFEETWALSREFFFDGTDYRQIAQLVESVQTSVSSSTCTGPMRQQLEFVERRLRACDVVLLGVRGVADPFGHWVLAVGLEELSDSEQSKVTSVLCIDCAEPAPEMLRYNARLELNWPRRGSTFVRYVGAKARTSSRTIECSIALRRKERSSALPSGQRKTTGD